MYLHLLILLSFVMEMQSIYEPRVTVKQGEMKGSVMNSFSGKEFLAFRGIPFGKPPVGEKRFTLPEPADNWNGVLDATKDGPICFQLSFINDSIVRGQEDCLYLNVYTPKLTSKTSTLLPVMFFIHPGAFLGDDGTSMFSGPHILMDRDIILVTFNYRLSALGFLSTEDNAAPGNYGLWDQNLALRWVQQNIHVFGGDKHLVTLFGTSSGGTSGSFHLISAASKGLFQRVISQSGSALCHWTFQRQPLKIAQRLAQDLNCTNSSTLELVSCLRQKDAGEILKFAFSYSDIFIFPLAFAPSVDKADGPKFLDDEPVNLFRNGRLNRVPIITGITDREGLLFGLTEIRIMETLKGEARKEYLENTLALFGGIDVKDVPEVLELYMKNINLTDINKSSFQSAYIDTISDAVIVAGYEQTLQYLTKYDIPVFAYKTEYQMKYTATKLQFGDNVTGVAHTEDMGLLIDTNPKLLDENIPIKLEGNDKIMSEKIKDLWINFATYGNPTPIGKNDVGVNWDKVVPDQLNYLRIRLPLEMASSSYSERIKIWNEKP